MRDYKLTGAEQSEQQGKKVLGNLPTYQFLK